MADPEKIAAALKFYESKRSFDPFGQQDSGERVMPTLAGIYSTIGSLKRKGADFIQNPVLGVQQMVGNANDQARALNQLTAESAQEGLSFGPKTKLLASQLAESYNPTGMFIGPNAASFNKSMASKAQELEKLNKPAEEIWQQTGTFRGPDGKLRQEISDQNIGFKQGSYGKDINGNPVMYQVNEGNASQVMAHPELFKAYPFLKKVNTEIGNRPKAMGSTEYGAEGKFLEAFGPTDEDIKSVLVHEMQHQIQNREKMAAGSGFMEGDTEGFKRYLRSAGEAEARATQARRNMSMEERRKLFPLSSYDVPIKELIFK
jgi:hypothetical protein